jgi:hypothetical protein
MPFERATRMLESLLSVQVNQETARRLTERMGGYMEAAQEATDEADDEPESIDQSPLQQCVLRADGTIFRS